MSNLLSSHFDTLGSATILIRARDYRIPFIISADPVVMAFSGKRVTNVLNEYIGNNLRPAMTAYYNWLMADSVNIRDFQANITHFRNWVNTAVMDINGILTSEPGNATYIMDESGAWPNDTGTYTFFKKLSREYAEKLAVKGNQIAIDAQAKADEIYQGKLDAEALSKKITDEAISQYEEFIKHLNTIIELGEWSSAFKDREALKDQLVTMNQNYNSWRLVVNTNDLARLNSARLVFETLANTALMSIQKSQSGVAIIENKTYGEQVITGLQSSGFYSKHERDKLSMTIAQDQLAASGLSTYVTELKKISLIKDLSQKRKRFETVVMSANAFSLTQSLAARSAPLYRATALEYNTWVGKINTQLGITDTGTNTALYLALAGVAAGAFVMLT